MASINAREILVWRCERSGATVRLSRGAGGIIRVIITSGRDSVALTPADALQIASGIDVAIQRLDRHGRLRAEQGGAA